jgi:hypothetical protein
MLGLHKCAGFPDFTCGIWSLGVNWTAPWVCRGLGEQKKGVVSSWAGVIQRSAYSSTRIAFMKNGSWLWAMPGSVACPFPSSEYVQLHQYSIEDGRCQEKPFVNFWCKDSVVLRNCTFCCFNIFLAWCVLSPSGLPYKCDTNIKSHTASFVPYRKQWWVCSGNSSGLLPR